MRAGRAISTRLQPHLSMPDKATVASRFASILCGRGFNPEKVLKLCNYPRISGVRFLPDETYFSTIIGFYALSGARLVKMPEFADTKNFGSGYRALVGLCFYATAPVDYPFDNDRIIEIFADSVHPARKLMLRDGLWYPIQIRNEGELFCDRAVVFAICGGGYFLPTAVLRQVAGKIWDLQNPQAAWDSRGSV